MYSVGKLKLLSDGKHANPGYCCLLFAVFISNLRSSQWNTQIYINIMNVPSFMAWEVSLECESCNRPCSVPFESRYRVEFWFGSHSNIFFFLQFERIQMKWYKACAFSLSLSHTRILPAVCIDNISPPQQFTTVFLVALLLVSVFAFILKCSSFFAPFMWLIQIKCTTQRITNAVLVRLYTQDVIIPLAM